VPVWIKTTARFVVYSDACSVPKVTIFPINTIGENYIYVVANLLPLKAAPSCRTKGSIFIIKKRRYG